MGQDTPEPPLYPSDDEIPCECLGDGCILCDEAMWEAWVEECRQNDLKKGLI